MNKQINFHHEAVEGEATVGISVHPPTIEKDNIGFIPLLMV